MKPRARFAGLLTCVSIALAGVTAGATASQAASCPSAEVGGRAVGWIDVGEGRVPIKRTTYPVGGQFDPPPSHEVVGLSARHQPLLADHGSTVLAWHVRYGKGCNGALNSILGKPVGSTFSLTSTDGARRTFRITERQSVKRGNYRPEWFRTNGTPQMTLFTCSDLRNGSFQRTRVIVAEPVAAS